MPKQLPLTIVDGGEFTWTRKPQGVIGVADESALPEHLISRVWNDACDVGFLVRGQGASNGDTLLFTHVHDIKGLSGQLLAKVFQCNDIPHIEIHIIKN